jgi:hypothetical protein
MHLSNMGDAAKSEKAKQVDRLIFRDLENPQAVNSKLRERMSRAVGSAQYLLNQRTWALPSECAADEPGRFADTVIFEFDMRGERATADKLCEWFEAFGDVRLCDLQFAFDVCALRFVATIPTIAALRSELDSEVKIPDPVAPKTETAKEKFMRIVRETSGA